MGVTAKELEGLQFYAGKGCEVCRHTGFKGRTAIFEYLAVDSDIRREISNRSDADRIKQVALEKGLVSLRQSGWQKVAQGITTPSEVLRVTLEK
jgi:type II secretory ATPase GspE/PulE/Tfp pilus assembly ATPase PilB-like protein